LEDEGGEQNLSQRFRDIMQRLPEGMSIAEERSLPVLEDVTRLVYAQKRNIPEVYERPGAWPGTRTIGNLPSVLGIVSGPSRTVHPQSHLGPSFNLPAVLTMRDDMVARQGTEWRFPLVNAALDQIDARRR
jgi:hypothetical protein